MQIQLPYGRTGYEIEIPDANLVKVLEAPNTTPLSDPRSAVEQALSKPIGSPSLVDLARGRDDAVVVICDMTRPVPNQIILPPILKMLESAGISPEKITLLVATGLHRPNEGAELEAMVGAHIARSYRFVNHRAGVGAELVHLGRTPGGIPIDINAVYSRASLKITTGYIEPHLMAGFSGGRKVLTIGCGGERLIRAAHSPALIEHPNSIEGLVEGNVIHQELTEVARRVGMDFMVNVTMDRQRRITGVFAGDFEQAWAEGCKFARDSVRDTVDQPCDIVVTSCGGYPQDCNFYQTAKAFTGAMHIARKGGTIIVLSACEEGLGGEHFRRLCRSVKSVEQFMREFVEGDRSEIDQWQINNLTRAMRKCDCILIDQGLTDEERFMILPRSFTTFETTLAAALSRHGPKAAIAVIPEGPNVLAQLVTRGL